MKLIEQSVGFHRRESSMIDLGGGWVEMLVNLLFIFAAMGGSWATVRMIRRTYKDWDEKRTMSFAKSMLDEFEPPGKEFNVRDALLKIYINVRLTQHLIYFLVKLCVVLLWLYLISKFIHDYFFPGSP